jgi:hypothetical protein
MFGGFGFNYGFFTDSRIIIKDSYISISDTGEIYLSFRAYSTDPRQEQTSIYQWLYLTITVPSFQYVPKGA